MTFPLCTAATLRRGYTLTELALVTTVLMALGAFAVVGAREYVDAQRSDRATVAVAAGKTAVETHLSRFGVATDDPATLAGYVDVAFGTVASDGPDTIVVIVGSDRRTGVVAASDGTTCHWQQVLPADVGGRERSGTFPADVDGACTATDVTAAAVAAGVVL